MIYINLIDSILNLIFREEGICFICGDKNDEELSSLKYVCALCLSELKTNFYDNCRQCGRKINYKPEDHKCMDCSIKENVYDKAVSPLCYEGKVKELISDFKYNDKSYYKKLFGEFMYLTALEQGFEESDLIIPVPMEYGKKLKRGYNQAELLAEYVSKKLDMDMSKGILLRKGIRRSQKSLTRIQRKSNLENVFYISDKDIIKDRNILLIDDVMTTGSTVGHCAWELKKQGAKAVFVLTAASTPCYIK